MYRPRAYTVDDPDVLYATVRARRFATIAAVVGGTVQFAYAPVLLVTNDGLPARMRFHLSRLNPLSDIDETLVRLSFLGPDAYISPDWYETPALVPTWNYVAVEAAGMAHRMEPNALRQLVIDLSGAEETQLGPKPAWTLDKVPEERVAVLLEAIRGFEVPLDSLAGKFKLSQDKGDADVAGAIAGLEARGDAASVAVAGAMRRAERARDR
jgi:transcriptional regulator